MQAFFHCFFLFEISSDTAILTRHRLHLAFPISSAMC
jgi:hypothetical protein